MRALTAPDAGTRRRASVRALFVGLSGLLINVMVPWIVVARGASGWPEWTLGLWALSLLVGLVWTAAHRPRIVGVAFVLGTLLGAVALTAFLVWAFTTAPGGWD